MNTEKEYQLIKKVIPMLQVARNPLGDGNYTLKQYKEWDSNQKNQIKDLKVRQFILNLNLRPELPLPEDVQMKIKRTALMDELKNKKHKKRHVAYYSDRSLIHFLTHINKYPETKKTYVNYYDPNKKMKTNRYTPFKGYKKEVLEKVFANHGRKLNKKKSVKQLVQEYMTF